jgi:nitrate/TMAO reductase-like tetraheme cytochrome c subunit
MKRYSVLVILLTLTAFVFSYCHSSKEATAAAPPKVAYQNGLHTVIMANCSPCHIPEKGGNKKAYDNYENAKTDIDEMLRRIQLNPGEKGFMPFKKDKLNDSTIAVFKKWKDDGLLEK